MRACLEAYDRIFFCQSLLCDLLFSERRCGEKMKERNSRYIYLLSAGHLFTDMNQGALPAIFPFFIAEYGFSHTRAASLVFALNLVSSIVQPVFGILSDKISKPWIMAGGALLAGSGLAAAGFISSYPLLFASVMISGIAAPALGKVANAQGLRPVMYIVAAVALLPAIPSFALPELKTTEA